MKTKLGKTSLAVATLLSIACGTTSASERRTETTGLVKIDDKMKANPYFKNGQRVGLAAGRARAEVLSCRDASIENPTSFDFEDASNEPYILGYLQGFIPAYEEARQTVFRSCVDQVQPDNESQLEYNSRQITKIRDMLLQSLGAYRDAGCGIEGTTTYCTEQGFKDISGNYFALAWYFSGPSYVTNVNVSIEAINGAQTKAVSFSNKRVQAELELLVRKDNLSESDIQKIKDLAAALKSPNKAAVVAPIKNPYL